MLPVTQTLLTILIVMISIIVATWLLLLVVIAISARKLLRKLHTIADSSGESVSMLKQQLARRVGFVSIIRYLMKRFG